MTTQTGFMISPDVEWFAISDNGPGVGPSLVIPISTLEGLSDEHLVWAIHTNVSQAIRASALNHAHNLLSEMKSDSKIANAYVARWLRENPSALDSLREFAHTEEVIHQAMVFAEHCLFYFPEKPVTPKVNKTPDVRAELQRKYHETFVKLGRRDGFFCQMCGDSGGDLQIDHVHPVSKGGTNDLDNLQLLCAACNLAKSDTVAEVCND